MTTKTQDDSMKKTPFEIRLEVLKMAKELATEEMYTKRDQIMEVWQANDRKGTLTFPEFPSNARILEKAQELYGFITTKA